MNSTIAPTLPPAAPGLLKARLPDKVQAVDGHASFAAALRTLSENPADLPLAAAEASAAHAKLPQRGKSLKATDETVDGNLAMLAAAAMPHTPVRSAAPLEAKVPTYPTSSQPRQQEQNRTPCGLRGWKLLALFPSVLNGSPQPRLRPARQCGSLAKPLRSGLIRRRAMPGSCTGKCRLRPQTHPLGRSQRNSPQQRAHLPGVCLRPNRRSQPTRAPRPRGLSRSLPPSCRRRKGGLLAREVVEGKAQASADAPAPGLPAPLALPGATSTHAAPQPAPAMQVSPLVGSSDWGEVLARHLVRLAPGGRREVELNLNPAELGPLKVTLSLAEGHAQVLFVSEHPAVRQALEAALPQLRTTFADNGISLGQASVGSGSSEHRPENGPGGHHRSPQTDHARFGAPPPDKPQHVAPAGRSSESAVDTFA